MPRETKETMPHGFRVRGSSQQKADSASTILQLRTHNLLSPEWLLSHVTKVPIRSHIFCFSFYLSNLKCSSEAIQTIQQ